MISRQAMDIIGPIAMLILIVMGAIALMMNLFKK